MFDARNLGIAPGNMRPRIEDYRGRFPDHVEVVDAIFEPISGHATGADPRPEATTTAPMTPSRETEGGDPAAPGARAHYLGKTQKTAPRI
jgi:hypothetical protein